MKPFQDFIRTVRRPYPPFYTSLIVEGMRDEELFRPYVDTPIAARHMIQVDHYFYYLRRDMDRISEVTLRSWLKPEMFVRAQVDFRRAEQALLLAGQSDDLRAFMDAYMAYMPSILLVWRIDGVFEKMMRQTLPRYFPAGEVDAVMGRLNIPSEDNFYKREMYDLVMASDIDAHVKKYEWYTSRYGARQPYTVAEARAKLHGVGPEKFFRDYLREKEELQKYIEQVKKRLGKDAYLVDIMQFIIFYRTQRTDIINRAAYHFADRLDREASERGYTYDQILYALADEVRGQLPEPAVLDERRRYYAVMMDDGVISCLIGDEARKVSEGLRTQLGEIDRFSGQPAAGGQARGVVRLIFSAADFEKFQDGDILVTSMTSPNFLPIMKRAAAVITDEGGITCHAAVIARELRKPCLIGTGVATDVLKDGDMVEVDADRGMVRRVQGLSLEH